MNLANPLVKVVFTFYTLTLMSVALLFSSCNNGSSESTTSEHDALPEEKNLVETVVILREDFMREIVSNGKLTAIQKAELYFKTDGIIADIKVKNGQTVSNSEVLAMLHNEDTQFTLKQSRMNLEKAEIDKKDALLSMGYNDLPENKILADHLRIANIRSGYNDAKLAVEKAENTLEKTTLKAPFEGKIEGLKQMPYERASLAEPFCTLINDSKFIVDFPLLETEIHEVQLGQKVSVLPIAGAQSGTGIITEINPRVDENGLIWLKAEVPNRGGYMEGMNVKINIKRSIPEQLVVPKQAVVLRQNREVLFRYTGGIAYWTYVNVLDENEKQYAVEAAEGAILNSGDTVIISNNLNLAHESQVEIDN